MVSFNLVRVRDLFTAVEPQRRELVITRMPHTKDQWIALRRELFSATIDPLTNQRTKSGFLSVGTLIGDPHVILGDAKARGVEIVTVRALDRFGGEALERVNAQALRGALPKVEKRRTRPDGVNGPRRLSSSSG
jgi:hypothetical protein